MRRYSLTHAADQDLEQIFDYGIDSFGVHVAIDYQRALIARFGKIAENPYLYQISPLRDGYRRSVCGVHSIYYRLVGDEVEIVRILGRQNASSHLD